ncbi:hypothetical protein A3B57_01280 [Microgenomates group bacterium RIFCSPLOWO2_01_FULL_47_10]|nr:MAG: hypothetical protein A3B57_01280 [Microgenomates group bacterium RIFCSPLOWO2_01_FULL_47_10]
MKHSNRHLLEVTLQLAKRDIKTRYAGSFLGPIWIIFYPLALTLSSTLIFSFFFKNSIQSIPYILYALSGFISWTYFSRCVAIATRSLVSNGEIIKNTAIPNEAIIYSTVISQSLDFAVNLGVFFTLSLYLHQSFSLNILLLPFIFLVQTCFQTGLILASSSINIIFRDIQNLVDLVLQLLFYVTPVIYPLSAIPGFAQSIILMNPLTHFLFLYRSAFFHTPINPTSIIIASFTTIISLILGHFTFQKLKPKFSEYL